MRTRLREGVYRPGDRFLSAREAAQTFGVSYQTAHRLLDELCAEGWLERRPASGTYIPGGREALTAVQLIFASRARRPQSFGARLFAGLTRRLDRDRIPWDGAWEEEAPEVAADCFPVLWESPAALAACLRARRPVLLLNDRPQPGLDAALLDSVSLDDFSGGACAAQLLQRDPPCHGKLAVLSGPPHDGRSRQRRDGFLSLAPGAPVVAAGGWYFRDGYRAAAEIVRAGPAGIFCGNDRLAEAVSAYCADSGLPCPRLVGFDDAPVAERLNLTTIAIPWEEMVAGAVEVIKRRLAGDTSAARQLIVTPRPVVRKL